MANCVCKADRNPPHVVIASGWACSPQLTSNLDVAYSSGKFIVSKAGEAYDAQTRG